MTVRIEVPAVIVYEMPDEVVWPDGADPRSAASARAELLSDMNGITTAGWIVEELIDVTWPMVSVTWAMPTAVEVDVANPAYSGDDVLFGDPPPATIVDRAQM